MAKISKLNDDANKGGTKFEFFKELEQYFVNSDDTVIDKLQIFQNM